MICKATFPFFGDSRWARASLFPVDVDEMLIAFRGNRPFRAYMRNKPAKFGMIISTLADVKDFCVTFENLFG